MSALWGSRSGGGYFASRLASPEEKVRTEALAELDQHGADTPRVLSDELWDREKHPVHFIGYATVLVQVFYTATILARPLVGPVLHYFLIVFAGLCVIPAVLSDNRYYRQWLRQYEALALAYQERGGSVPVKCLLRLWSPQAWRYSIPSNETLLRELILQVELYLTAPRVVNIDAADLLALRGKAEAFYGTNRRLWRRLAPSRSDITEAEADLLTTVARLLAASKSDTDLALLRRMAELPAIHPNRRFVRETAAELITTKSSARPKIKAAPQQPAPILPQRKSLSPPADNVVTLPLKRS